MIRMDFVPWANTCNSINNMFENGLFLTMLKGISLKRRKFASDLSACSFLVLVSIELIDGCEPGVVQGTKNDVAAIGLVDAAVEPVPLPSVDLFSCLLISSLASLVWFKFSNALMALWMSSGFVFVQGPTYFPGICAR